MLIDKSGRGQAFEENQQIIVAYRLSFFGFEQCIKM
jgi:hypothetical protein